MSAPCTLLPQSPHRVDRSLFDLLHPQGRQLIRAWAARGQNVSEDADASAYFEGFIYLWFGLNAWGSCVTGTDTDRDWINAVSSDEQLAQLFGRSIRDNDHCAAEVTRFADLWPIFKSSEIRRQGIWVPTGATRQQRVRQYLDSNIPFEPSCWHDHRGQRPPADWQHCLKTLYRVRCNLFHGEKSLNSENDRLIVSAAYRVLRQVLRVVELIDDGRNAV